MLDDLAAMAEQLRAAQRDGDIQREMKAKAREQRNRVTTLLVAAVGLLKKAERQYEQSGSVDFDSIATKVKEVYTAYMTPGAVVTPDQDAEMPITELAPESKSAAGEYTVRVHLDQGSWSVTLPYADLSTAQEAAAFIAINGLRSPHEGSVWYFPTHRIHVVEIENAA